MRVVLWTVIFVTFLVKGIESIKLDFENDDVDENERLWPIPQLDGTVRLMTEKEAEKEAVNSSIKEFLWGILGERSKKVRYLLYTKRNPVMFQEIHMGDLNSLIRSNFNKSHQTKFMVHGWLGNKNAPQNMRVQDALFFNGEERNFNYFVVDWSVYGRTPNYIIAQRRVRRAGAELAEFIDWLHDKTEMSFDNLTIAGHSLGAHVVGFAGKNVKKGKIPIIYGLDPAMPLFRFSNPKTRLSSTDGKYVETIQTNGQWLGFYHPIGTASFYPNGGKHQPGCTEQHYLTEGGCSHDRTVTLYAEALALGDNNKFHAIHCLDFQEMYAGKCGNNVTNIRMGDPNNLETAKGIYYLKTTNNSPFGLAGVW